MTIGASHDFLSMVKDADVVVRAVLALLLGLSLASWTVIFLKLGEFFQAKRQSAIFLRHFQGRPRIDDLAETAMMLERSPVAHLFLAAYREINRFRAAAGEEGKKGLDPRCVTQIERTMAQSAESERLQLERRLSFLATTGSTAPFIGLFGTVWGIMNAFRGLVGASGSTSITVVAPGISEALVATAVGLAAAIPAVIAYNHFLARIRFFEVELDRFSTEFSNMLERQSSRHE
ncbi:MAG: Tol-Pal system subunit TolQ [Deltaproteobacteria bacterium]|nr:MAG: Tol-Pal system subunit TolQ [Deltaproteobacteria bacterium]